MADLLYIYETPNSKVTSYKLRIPSSDINESFRVQSDAVRVRDKWLEEGIYLSIPKFDPYGDVNISYRQDKDAYGVSCRNNGRDVYIGTAKTLGEAKKIRNEYFGLRTIKCSRCGKTVWTKFDDDICNDCYMVTHNLKPTDSNVPIEYKHPELVEKEARKVGKHYADIQKEKTLALLGKIKIPAFALRPEQKAEYERMWGSNWEKFYEQT